MRKKAGWIALYIVIVALLASIIYGVPSIMGLIRGDYIAKPGEIRKDLEVDAYLVRNETIYASDVSAGVKRIAEEGNLVGYGDEVVELIKGRGSVSGTQYRDIVRKIPKEIKLTDDGKAADAGFVMYESDGLEYIFSPNKLPVMTENFLKDHVKKKSRGFSRSIAHEGTSIFKIVENGPWGIVFFVDKKEAADFNVGRDFEIEFKEQKSKIRGKVVASEEKSGKTRVVIQSQDYFDGLLKLRQAQLRIPVSSGKGLIIRNSSIVKKNGRSGVIVKDKVGNKVFKPISVIADDGNKSAVYDDIYVDKKGHFVETLIIYDKIIRRPDKREVKEAKELPNNID